MTQRCVAEHERLTIERSHRPYQGLFAVVQGAQYEDLRRASARGLAALDVDDEIHGKFQAVGDFTGLERTRPQAAAMGRNGAAMGRQSKGRRNGSMFEWA